jgi:protein CpxP
MNKKILTIALAVALPFTVAAFPGGDGPDGFRGHKGDHVERLAEDLGLDVDQKAKLQDIFKEERSKREALREETHSRIKEVLTPEQMSKFEERKKAHQEKWQKRHHERMQKGGAAND